MRLFIALPLPAETHADLGGIIRNLQQASAPVRWVKAAQIHLTLRFLGETDSSLLPSLTHLIDQAARQHAALELRLDRLGAFPNLRRPRVYWIGTADPKMTQQLGDLARDIELGVRELGFEAEGKRFKPHLTLGRVKHPGNLETLTGIIEADHLPSIMAPLTSIALLQSTLTPWGALYQSLHEAALVGKQPPGDPSVSPRDP